MRLIRRVFKKLPLFLIKPCLPNKFVTCDGPGFKILVCPPRISVVGRLG